MTFCACQLLQMRLALTSPTPSTVDKRYGSCSITSNTLSLNANTNFLAKYGLMPLINPEPRYFSIPSSVLGGKVLMKCALNCLP